MLQAIRSLPRTVWLVGLISLINDSASEMLYPLVPIYLASVLMAGARVLGLIEGVAEATASLLKLFSGVIVDRTRRSKPWIMVGYGLAGLARPLTALVTAWPGLLATRFADRIGKGLRSSPRDALLAASVPSTQRGLAFGLHRAMDNSGAVLGPLIASLLLTAGMPLRDIFLWSLLPGLACLGLALAIRETPAASHAPAAPFDWHLNNMPPAFRRYLAIVALFTLGNSSNMFLLLRARELGIAEAQIPLLWAAVSLIAALFSTPLSALSDRYGRVRLLAGGYLAYGIFYLALGNITGGSLGLFGLFGFYGLFMAATEGVEKALVADLAPPDRQGTAFGWFNLTAGAMLLPASVIFGWLWQGIASWAAFLFSGSCALLAAWLLQRWIAPRGDLASRPAAHSPK